MAYSFEDLIKDMDKEDKKKKKTSSKDANLTDYQRAVQRHNETVFDTTASPDVQRLDPAFQSKSLTGTNYDWEKDMLSSLPIRSYGRSYNDKFDTATRQLGMYPTQAQEFRRWLDAGEKMEVSDGFYAAEAEAEAKKQKEAKKKEEGKKKEEKHSFIDGFLSLFAGNDAKPKAKATDKYAKADAVLQGAKSEHPSAYAKANEVLQGQQSVAPDEYAKANAVMKAIKDNPSLVDDRNAFEKVMDTINSGLATAYDNTLGPVQDVANRFATNVVDGMSLGQFKKNMDKMGAPEFVKEAASEPTNGVEKAADITGQFAGMVAPISAAYKPASLLAKGAFTGAKGEKYLEAGLRGGLAMGMYSGAQEGLDEVIHPEDGDFNSRAKNVALNVGLGALGDPALLAAGAGLKAGAQNVLGRMAKVDGELPTYNGQVANSILDRLAPTQGTTQANSGSLYESLIKQANPGVKEADEAIAAAQAQKQQLEDAFVNQEIFGEKGPNQPSFDEDQWIKALLGHETTPRPEVNPAVEANIREQFNRTPQAQQLDDLIAQLTGQKDSALNAPAREPLKVNDWRSNVQEPAPIDYSNITPNRDIPINNWQDNIVNNSQVDEVVQPKLNESQVNAEMLKEAQQYRAMATTPEEAAALDNLIAELGGKPPVRDLKAEEDAFVSEQMKPHYEKQQQAANAQTQWENVVKRSKEEIQNIKGTFGKIYVPSHSLEDYPVPKQFLAGSKDKHSDDIFSFVDQMGFSSPEEAVQYLQVLDAESKTKLKDMMPDGLGETKDLRYMEESLRKQFRGENGTPAPQQNDVLDTLDELVRQNEDWGKPPSMGDDALDNFLSELEGKPRPKAETETVNPAPVSGEVAAGPETSVRGKPLGITAGAHYGGSAYSWIGNRPSTLEKLQTGKITAKTLSQEAKTNFSSTAQAIKDTMKDLAKMDTDGNLERLLGSKKILAYGDNLYKQLRGVSRSTGQAINASKQDYGKIIDTLRKNKISTDDFNAYAANVHFYDVLMNNRAKAARYGEVTERLTEVENLRQATNDKNAIRALDQEEAQLLKEQDTLKAYEIPAGVTEDTVKQQLNRWKNTPVMSQMQQEFIAAQRRDLEMLVRDGVYSQGQVDAMISANPNYVYMGRVKEESQMMNPSNVSKVSQHIRKRGTGSDEKIYPPLESAIRNRLMSYSNANRNAAMQTIRKYAQVNGSQKFFKEVNPHELSDSQKRNLLKFFEDGKDVYYEVPPALKDAFDSLDVKYNDDLIADALRAVGNVTRKGATHLNLDFIFSSPFRETGALITSRTGLHPGELVLGYLDSFMGKGLEKASGGLFKSYKEMYKQMGGHQTGFVTTDPQSTKAFIKAMDKGTLGKGIDVINPFSDRNWIGKIGQNVEHGPKLAEFRSAKNKGLDDANAMHEAVDVIDYNEGGKAIKALNHIPFLGASIRGTTRYLQAAKENPVKFAGKNLMYVSLPTVGIYAMRFAPTTSEGQRQKLRNLSDFQKNAFWYIPVPNSKEDKLLAFPKLYVGAQLFANPIERALDHWSNEDPTTFKRFMADTKSDFKKLMPPTTIAGLSQLQSANANYDPMMEMPIEDAAMKKNPNKAEHYNSFTSEAAKWLGKKTDSSPAKIDYVLKGVTGGTGRDVLDVMDNILSKTGAVERPQKVDTILDILNPTRRFVYKDTSGSGAIDRLLYNDKSALKDNEYARAQYREQTGERTAPKTIINQMNDMNKDISKAIKGIREDTKMSSAEKKKKIAQLRSYQRVIGDEAIKSGFLKDY